jgi:DNA-binding PadR family transcriptional regulator
MDRGALGPVNIIGTTLKRLVDTGMVELTQAPRSRGNRKARYRLTEKGLNKARRFS